MKKYILVFLIVLGTITLSGCVEKTPACNDNESRIDGVCVVNRTEFETKLYNTANLDNVTIEWVVTLGEETSTSILKFDGQKSSVQAGNHTEFYETDGTTTYRYFQTENGYKRETVQLSGSTQPSFYENLKETDFTLMENRYLLNYGTYNDILGFVKSYDSEATFSNFELSVETYITQIKFDILVGNLVYKLTLNYSNHNQTTVEVPTYA